MSRSGLLALGTAWLCLGAACSGPVADPPVLVFAAASLTAPFEALADEFQRRHAGRKVELHFAGTSQLVFQVREGAPADVLAAADRESLEKLVAAGRAESSPRVFAKNRLAIVTGHGNPKGIRGLADLAHQDLRVVLCGPEVPAGRYARQALAKAAVAVQPVSDEPSVKAVASKVALGEADAGIVYVTDVVGTRLTMVAIPDQHNVVASYPIAVLTTGRNPEVARELVAFALAGEGRRILKAAGFGVE